MKKLYQVLVQNVDEGHWDVMFEGSEQECLDFEFDYSMNDENYGTWTLIKVEEVKEVSISDQEMRTIKMALSEYYLNLMNMSCDRDEFVKYYKEEKELISKLERMNK